MGIFERVSSQPSSMRFFDAAKMKRDDLCFTVRDRHTFLLILSAVAGCAGPAIESRTAPPGDSTSAPSAEVSEAPVAVAELPPQRQQVIALARGLLGVRYVAL